MEKSSGPAGGAGVPARPDTWAGTEACPTQACPTGAMAPFFNTLRGRRRLALLVLLGATLLACEYPGVPHPLAGRAGADGALVAAPPAAGLVRSAPRENPSRAGTAQSGEITVGLKDFFLDPDRIAVKSGQLVFDLKNEGRYTHDFRVEGNGVDEKAPKVGIGHSLRWEITLAAGTYQISCPISNHAERGMNGTLVVE